MRIPHIALTKAYVNTASYIKNEKEVHLLTIYIRSTAAAGRYLREYFHHRPNGFGKKPYRKHGLPRKDEKEMLLLTTYVRLTAVTIGWCDFL